MTQTVQPCSRASLNKADKDLSEGKVLTKAEAEEKLKFIFSTYDIVSRIIVNLNKLDYEIKEILSETDRDLIKLKEDKLNRLISTYDAMSKIDIDKLDYELKKTCIELSNYFEKVKFSTEE